MIIFWPTLKDELPAKAPMTLTVCSNSTIPKTLPSFDDHSMRTPGCVIGLYSNFSKHFVQKSLGGQTVM